MKTYKCHKSVQAEKIVRMDLSPDETGFYVMYGADGSKIRCSSEWMNKNKPYTGGYYVVYNDGYASFSPAKAFEDGYTEIELS